MNTWSEDDWKRTLVSPRITGQFTIWKVKQLKGLTTKKGTKLKDPNSNLNCEQVFPPVILRLAIQQVAKVGAEHCVASPLGNITSEMKPDNSGVCI